MSCIGHHHNELNGKDIILELLKCAICLDTFKDPSL